MCVSFVLICFGFGSFLFFFEEKWWGLGVMRGMKGLNRLMPVVRAEETKLGYYLVHSIFIIFVFYHFQD